MYSLFGTFSHCTHLPKHPHVSTLITTLLATPDDQVADVLEPISSWKWPRSDLHSWVNVLNKFDEIYENIIREYEVEKLQCKDFSLEGKRTLLEVLKFQRLLLENSTNRKLFSSYDVSLTVDRLLLPLKPK